MDWGIVLLRLVHIGAGVFWAGGAFLVAGFLEPAVRGAGPEGGRFMQRLVQQHRLPMYLLAAGALAILSGVVLYWRMSGGLQPAYVTSPVGLTFALGGLAAILAFVLASIESAPVAARLGAAAGAMQAAGGPPTPEQLAELGGLQARLTRALRLTAGLLAVAVIAMAIARYMR